MSEDGLELTVYFGERDRAMADALAGVFGRHGLHGSVILRGASGFGARHRLRSDQLLTLSEDLPMVAVAVDTRARVLAALPDVERLGAGLVTVEPVAGAAPDGEEAKLTLYVGRHERMGSEPAYEAIVGGLHRHGVAGATVLLGVDGTLHGTRRRARLFGGNGDVPLMIVSVGEAARLTAALAELGTPLATWAPVRVCKRDGQRLAEPSDDPSGLQKLTVYGSEQSGEIVRHLRAAGAAGATALRGHWGYHGDHPPHGDRFWHLRRHVPVVTAVVDTPANVARWFEIVDELTQESGLVTSERVSEAPGGVGP